MEGFNPTPRTPLEIITGERGPEQFNTEQVKVEMKDEIVSYMPNAHPLQTLTTHFKDTEQITNYRFDWIEDDAYPRELVLTGASAPGDLGLDVTVGDEARVAAGYELLNVNTGELVLVTSTASGAVNVTRDIGGTGQTNMAIGDRLVFIAPVAEDGADIGTIKTTKKTPMYNYCQIMRYPFGWTRRGSKIDLFGGKDPAYTRKKAGAEHAKSTELAFIFGKRDLKTGTHLTTYTDGVVNRIRNNVLDVSGTGNLTEEVLDEYLETALREGDGGYLFGTGTKYAFFSARLITRINKWAKDKLQYRTLDKTIGFSALEYLSPHGRLMILHTPVLDYYHSGWGFILDLNHITKMVFGGDDLVLLKDRQNPGVDGIIEEYLSDVGLRIELADAHGLVKGVR
jgi:hypothetical protein